MKKMDTYSVQAVTATFIKLDYKVMFMTPSTADIEKSDCISDSIIATGGTSIHYIVGNDVIVYTRQHGGLV